MSDEHEKTEDGVPETGTDEEGVDDDDFVDSSTRLNIPTLDAIKASARNAVTDEGRLAVAKPFHIPPPINCELMVAPAIGTGFYDKIFNSGKALFASGADGIDVEEIDRGFVKMVVIDCVVMPKLDDEAVELLIQSNPAAFHALVNFCMNITMLGTMTNIGEKLGNVDSEAQQLFFEGIAGSGSTPTQQ